MAKLSYRKLNQDRRRFRPGLEVGGDAATVLDRRLMPSGGLVTSYELGHAAVQAGHSAERDTPSARAHRRSRRLAPAQAINSQYAAFLAAFHAVEQAYISTINEQSSTTVSVSATVTEPYAAGSPIITVDNAAVFGPQGTFSTPVTATALVSQVTVGQFVLTGSSGNQVTLNPGQSSFIPLNPGAVLSANVPVTAQSSASAIFPSYITAATDQLAVKLVRYFNSLPISLPRKITPPHQPQQSGAIQQYMFQHVAGSASNSLQQALLAITLPTTPGADLRIYDAAVNTTVNASRLQVRNGVHQIFAGKLQIPGQFPTSSTGISSSSSSSTSSSSNPGGSGTTSSDSGTSSGTG